MKILSAIAGDKAPGWEFLLNQEGFSYVYLRNIADHDYSVLIVPESVDDKNVSMITEYLRVGGGVLCSANSFEKIATHSCRSEKIKYLVPELQSPLDGVGVLDVDMICQIPGNANCFHTNGSNNAVFCGEWGGGYIIVLPFDAGQLVLDHRICMKSFYSSKQRLPFERVSLVNRAALRKLVSRSLQILHHRRGLPYIHLWYYPDAQPSVFMFRIDTDYADKGDIEKLYTYCQQHNTSATWFLDVKSQQGILNVFTQMQDQEIGIHCFEHKIFDDVESNVKNISMAKNILDDAGLHARGFAAPYGAWNPAIAAAISMSGFEYSSEFSYDYDNLPSYPVAGMLQKSVLQIPVHPISIGSLKRQGFSDEEMIEYFRSAIGMKESSHDPMCFYHHPKNGHEDVLQTIFNHAAEKNVPAMTMHEYSLWWKQRDKVRLSSRYESGKITLTAEGESQNIMARITSENGREAFIPAGESILEAEIQWRQKPQVEPLPGDINRIRQFNFWIPLIRFEDFLHNNFRQS
ncbi:MAG: polysaccharide deacetylase family protein [Bacteroidota bacterium]